MAKLSRDYASFNREVDKLSDLQSHVSQLPPKYPKVVAEMVMLRLFDLYLECIVSISTKIVCGAQLVDGSSSLVLATARSSDAALNMMRTTGRKKPKLVLRWSKATDVKDNVKYVIKSSDNFVRVLDHNALFIDEMRRVRNRIAHNNSRSRAEYQVVVRRYYGAVVSSLSPGTLLLSPRQSPPLIGQYLARAKILVKELVKA